MRVLIFTTQFLHIGGFERLAVELAIELNRNGIPSDLLGQYSRGSTAVIEAEQRLLDAGVPNVLYLGLSINPGVFAVLLSIFRFRKLVKRGGYTAIEVSGFLPALISAVALFGMNVRVLIGVHEKYSTEMYSSLKFFVWKHMDNAIRF